MPAPKGHKRWGNPMNVKKLTPEELWEGACNYFEWCDKNPWLKNEFNAKVGEIVSVPTQKPYSIEGLCIYLDISSVTFLNYSTKEGYETYFSICTRIKEIIDNQHFEGGMVGAFNANIVTRKLGLKENLTIEKPEKPIITFE